VPDVSYPDQEEHLNAGADSVIILRDLAGGERAVSDAGSGSRTAAITIATGLVALTASGSDAEWR
jgi:hypothetical protein